MVPEGNNLSDVGSPGRVKAEAAEVWFTETTPKEVITQPIDCLIHLLATSKQCSTVGLIMKGKSINLLATIK